MKFILEFGEKIRLGFYDKKTKEPFVADDEKADLDYNGYSQYGFTNDIDGIMQFYPKYLNTGNELVTLAEAYQVVRWFNENPEKAAKLPPHLQELRNLTENDNPLVMIAKLKE